MVCLTFSTELFVLGGKRERVWYTNLRYDDTGQRPGVWYRMCFDKIWLDSPQLMFQGDGTKNPPFSLVDVVIVDGEPLLPRSWYVSFAWRMSHNMNVGVMDSRRGIIGNQYA